MSKSKLLLLDIGCGDRKHDAAIGIDTRRTKAVDIIADAAKLPFKQQVFDHVYSSHTIEHFSHHEIEEVVKEWARVLKQNGIIEIRCPWLRLRALLFFLRPTQKNVENIYGGQDYAGNYHKCGFSFGLLKNLMESVGIIDVRRVLEKYKGIPFVSDLHVIGVKK